MSRKISFSLLVFLITFWTFAQRFCYVDHSFILGQTPAYQEARKNLDQLIETWSDEVSKKKLLVEEMQSKLQYERLLLLEDKIKEREEKIQSEKNELDALENKYFHPKEGQLVSSQSHLIGPIEARIHEAVKKVASEKKYSFVFNKDQIFVILGAGTRFNITSDVMRELGINK